MLEKWKGLVTGPELEFGMVLKSVLETASMMDSVTEQRWLPFESSPHVHAFVDLQEYPHHKQSSRKTRPRHPCRQASSVMKK